MTDVNLFSESVFVFFALVSMSVINANQKLIILVLGLFFVLRGLPVDVFAFWFTVGSILLVIGSLIGERRGAV